MKRLIFLIFLLCVFTLFLFSSIGDNHVPPTPSGNFVDPNIPKIDYNSPLTYNDASFWGSGTDYDKIQWNQVTFNQIPWDSVDKNENPIIDQSKIPVEYIHKIPANKINVETVLDRTKITSEQWGYKDESKDNLNLAGDLNQYPSAQKAVFDRHSGNFQKIDLSNGNTNYKDGVLTNGGVKVDLNDENIKGTEITALEGGGFSIGKGESSKFDWGGNEFDLENAEKPVKIGFLGQITLPDKAKMVGIFGTEVTSFDDLTTISVYGTDVVIAGIAHFKDKYFDGYLGQVGEIKQTGTVNIDQTKKDETRYKLQNCALYRTNGFNYEQVDKKVEGDSIFLADGVYFSNILNSHPDLEGGLPGLEKKWQDVLPGVAKDAAKDIAGDIAGDIGGAAVAATFRYIKENPEEVLNFVQKNQKLIQNAAAFLHEHGMDIADFFNGPVKIGFGGGGAGVVYGDAGIYAGLDGKVTAVYNIDEKNVVEIYRNPGGKLGTGYRYNAGKLHAFFGMVVNEDLKELPQFQGGLRLTWAGIK
jgi:hypothetical protein